MRRRVLVSWFGLCAAACDPLVHGEGAPAGGSPPLESGIREPVRPAEGTTPPSGSPEPAASEAGAPPASLCAPISALPEPRGPILYVAPDGSDTRGTGAIDRPFATLARGSAAARPGDTVILRGGVYRTLQEQYIAARGTAAAPIVFRAAPGERPILDGSDATLAGTFGGDRYRGLVTVAGAHLVFDGLEVRVSAASGLKLYQASHVTIRRSVFHDIAQHALGGSGDDITLEGNEVYRASLANEGGAIDRKNGGSGWAPAVLSWRFDNPMRRSQRWRMVGNYVHDVWGECLDALYLDGGDVVGNAVHGCYSASIYIDNGRSLRIERNHVAVRDGTYARPDGQRAHGIVLATESADIGCEAQATGQACPLEGLRIANNLVVGAPVGILYWHRSGARFGYRNLELFHNVVFGPQRESVYIGSSGGVPVGPAVAANNVFFGQGAAAPVLVEDHAVWTFRNNVYPSGVAPTLGRHEGNLVGDAGLRAASLDADPEAFRPAASSPLRGAGASTPLETDFACRPRPAERPTPGLFEP